MMLVDFFITQLKHVRTNIRSIYIYIFSGYASEDKSANEVDVDSSGEFDLTYIKFVTSAVTFVAHWNRIRELYVGCRELFSRVLSI